ncbi:MAG: sugar phosphate isomerase/epimerase family protein [Verrucomicrobiota bacterium]
MSFDHSRRSFLSHCGVAAAATTALGTTAHAQPEARPSGKPNFRYCLNTSTIRETKLPLDQLVELTAKAGYNGIEPWMREIAAYKDAGGNLKDLGKKIADLGLKVESAIGFANWIVDDEAQRKKGLEDAKRDMDLLAQIGGLRIAAPPVGAQKQEGMNLDAAAERYYDLLQIGDDTGVLPQVELWGFSKTLHKLGEVAYVAIESGHPKACILTDVYHIYKGGSDFSGLRTLSGTAMHVMHMNDYPSTPPRETIGDADRVYPGDGVAPLSQILQWMNGAGFEGVLSLELFNPDYWKEDPAVVAKTGLEKMKTAVKAAFA